MYISSRLNLCKNRLQWFLMCNSDNKKNKTASLRPGGQKPTIWSLFLPPLLYTVYNIYETSEYVCLHKPLDALIHFDLVSTQISEFKVHMQSWPNYFTFFTYSNWFMLCHIYPHSCTLYNYYSFYQYSVDISYLFQMWTIDIYNNNKI